MRPGLRLRRPGRSRWTLAARPPAGVRPADAGPHGRRPWRPRRRSNHGWHVALPHGRPQRRAAGPDDDDAGPGWLHDGARPARHGGHARDAIDVGDGRHAAQRAAHDGAEHAGHAAEHAGHGAATRPRRRPGRRQPGHDDDDHARRSHGRGARRCHGPVRHDGPGRHERRRWQGTRGRSEPQLAAEARCRRLAWRRRPPRGQAARCR
mmetsp:Transcript_37011/g.95589  ORF Transcript_37011/g.95589 Transcript_37011/m.95589 type:complete len:207 (-) Transcript_37011:944-1564(-)